MGFVRRLVALLVVPLLAGVPAVSAQVLRPGELRIIVLEGRNAINYIPLRAGTTPVVEVRDVNDHPIEGAVLVFKLPSSGPGATFDNGVLTQTVTTDFRGQARPAGYAINDKPGRFSIEVTAAYQNQAGRALIPQTNSLRELPAELQPPKHSSKLKWILIAAAAGAGAGLGIYFGTRSSNSPISVGTGPVTIGGPR